jgi:hypothetical protein
MTEPTITRRKLTDYTPDPRNANAGTERGVYMVDRSVEEVGAGRSLVSTADGVIAAGNKTLQALVDAGIVDVIEVETDGKTAVVVKRKDWDGIEDAQARKYAYFDNRASEVGLAWDAEQVLADVNAGVDLDALFHDWELDKVLGKVADAPFDPRAEWEGMPEFEQPNALAPYSIKVHFMTIEDMQQFAELMQQTITESTKYIYFPERLKESRINVVIADES